jgi:high affinity Mn2+ porin
MVRAFLPELRWYRFVVGCCAALLYALALAGRSFAQSPAGNEDLPPQPVVEQEEPPKEQQGKKNPPEEKPGAPASEGAASGSEGNPAPEKEDWYSVHGQGTIVSQGNWKFRSPYQGANSLLPILSLRTTETATLYLDVRPWQGTEVIFNPEISGGEGLSHTLGLAGFPNGEATRVGEIQPTPYVARLLLRETIGLDGDPEKTENGPNQLAGYRDIDRITISIGKMSATDIFDDNRYSHDPRTQFLNWSLMYTGAWDYPANARGYTYGMTVDFNTRYVALRYGVFAEPTVANGQDFDPRFLKANGHMLETEYRYELADHPGRVHLWGYLNHAHMGQYREALAEMPVNPNITLTRAYRIKYGFGMNLEQELTTDLGFFLRAGWNDGQSESWAFTEIDQTVAMGLSWKGRLWHRPKDEAGTALVVNGISNAHRDYLAAGGLGFIIGDGRLRYAPEEIAELYYNWELREGINVTADFEGVNHPAYNQDRGPVGIFALRVHFAY